MALALEDVSNVSEFINKQMLHTDHHNQDKVVARIEDSQEEAIELTFEDEKSMHRPSLNVEFMDDKPPEEKKLEEAEPVLVLEISMEDEDEEDESDVQIPLILEKPFIDGDLLCETILKELLAREMSLMNFRRPEFKESDYEEPEKSHREIQDPISVDSSELKSVESAQYNLDTLEIPLKPIV